MNSIITPSCERRRFQGASQMVRFNWHFYLFGGIACLGILLAFLLLPLPVPAKVLLGAGGVCAVFWLLGSVVTAYYVYDFSPLYKWEWLSFLLPAQPRRWVNIHSGFDETSAALFRLFPDGTSIVFDIYDRSIMTEPSIERARRWAPSAVPAVPVHFAALPLSDSGCDAVFLIFAAHEIRDPESRLRLFRELYRVVTPKGTVLLVEHLRDLANFLAFGPGFFHFFSRKEWLRIAEQSGFCVVKDQRMTPFVRVLLLERSP